jgi:phage terminase large subunit
MTTQTIESKFQPTLRQWEAAAARQRWVLYGGGEGGGKTRWLVETVLDILLDNPGIEGIIGRFDYNDVMTPTQVYDVFHQVCPREIIMAEYRSPPAWVRLHNGSRVTFMGLHDYAPSAEFAFAAVDQAEEVPEETLRLLNGRLRQRLPDGSFPRFRMLLTCNPHPAIEWVHAQQVQYPDDYLFVPALFTDNPYLPADFEQQRRRSYTDDQYRRLLLGSWDVYEGQALPEFDRNIHVVEPFDTWRKEHWPVYRGIDHGLTAPTVCEWIARDPDEGDMYIVQEYERAGEVPEANAKAIAAMSLDMALNEAWGDPRTAHKNIIKAGESTPWSVQEEYQRQGVYYQLARETRETRLAAWKQGLKVDPMRRHYLTHQPGAPKVYIFRNCQRLIWELPRLQMRAAYQGEDVEKGEDHAYDAGGFVLSALLAQGGRPSRAPEPMSFLSRR